MGYLFDPDNWEWLTTGNNLRFLLEGFLVNLEIAAIAIVFSLAVGLLLALARLAKLKPLSVAAGVWIDVWRNLPLIFIILYLALALPAPWKDFYESNLVFAIESSASSRPTIRLKIIAITAISRFTAKPSRRNRTLFAVMSHSQWSGSKR